MTPIAAAPVLLVVLIMAVMLFIALANESLSLALVCTAAGLLGLQFLSEANPLAFAQAHLQALGFVALAYAPLGILWSFFRWWRLLQQKASNLRDDKATWRPDYRAATWEAHINNYMPKAKDSKQRITCWIAYWPVSIVVYLTMDVLRDIGNWIYNQISGIYQRIADHVKASIGDV